MRRIVVTGGPGAGKTASLEMARRMLCEHVVLAPESASIVFGGGFPRERGPTSERAAQRAIFHVQRELEALFDARRGVDLLLCDRGTVDGLAYWPGGGDDFFTEVGTTRAAELARYDVVIHLRPPPDGDGYETSAIRVESAEEASRLDLALERAWSGHPRRVYVEHTHDFFAKVRQVVALLEGELSCRHARAGAC